MRRDGQLFARVGCLKRWSFVECSLPLHTVLTTFTVNGVSLSLSLMLGQTCPGNIVSRKEVRNLLIVLEHIKIDKFPELDIVEGS